MAVMSATVIRSAAIQLLLGPKDGVAPNIEHDRVARSQRVVRVHRPERRLPVTVGGVLEEAEAKGDELVRRVHFLDDLLRRRLDALLGDHGQRIVQISSVESSSIDSLGAICAPAEPTITTVRNPIQSPRRHPRLG